MRDRSYCCVRMVSHLHQWAKLTIASLSAWHAYKYIDPKESGAVLPIVHVNGFKISERTIYGCMDDKELDALFTGYGYQVRIVGRDLNRIDEDMAASLQWALGVIRSIQKAARQSNPISKPRWPVIILRTPKVRMVLTRRRLLFTNVLSLGLGCTCEVQG